MLWLVSSLSLLLSTPVFSLTQEEIDFIHSKGRVDITHYDDRQYLFEAHGHPEGAHNYDDFPTHYNPNSIAYHNFTLYIVKDPVDLPEENGGCMPLGMIGIATTGVAMYNPWEGGGTNAVEGENQEPFDECKGHPDPTSVYHYHQLPICIPEALEDGLVGVALDGNPIYGIKDKETGQELTSADLDICHGRIVDGRYQYHVTRDFPYILGCFRSWVDSRSHEFYQAAGWNDDGNGGGGGGGDRPPPPDGEGDGDRPPPPEGEGNGDRPPPPDGGGGGGNSCSFADPNNPEPAGWNDLQLGELNNGYELDELIEGVVPTPAPGITEEPSSACSNIPRLVIFIVVLAVQYWIL